MDTRVHVGCTDAHMSRTSPCAAGRWRQPNVTKYVSRYTGWDHVSREGGIWGVRQRKRSQDLDSGHLDPILRAGKDPRDIEDN